MPRARNKTFTVWEDGGAIVLARIVGNDGSNITQASITSIAYLVYDTTSSAQVITGSVTVATSVFDTLQDDDRWPDSEATGYNFRHALPATAFPTGGHEYQVEYKFTPSSGEVFYIACAVEALETFTT